jgi:gluconate 2-dehydrogenase gamma chain
MPFEDTFSRRLFLKSGGNLAGAACLRLLSPALITISQAACSARDTSAPYSVLAEDEAGDLAAIAARIIPTTDTPGATEAGVIHFIDRAFELEMHDKLDEARSGLAAFNRALADAHRGTRHLAELEPGEQDAFLKTRQHSDFFNLVRLMTIYGFFAMAEYGGNRDHVGWDLIGFEGHHGAWQYPFGYYDAAAMREPSDGE